MVVSFSAKEFIKTYGVAGISAYGTATLVSISSLYLALRTGKVDSMITTPLEQVLGKESELVQKVKDQLAGAKQQQQQTLITSGEQQTNTSNTTTIAGFNIVREGTYLGVASILDSFMLPVKLAVCLPIAKFILRRRGGR